MQLNNNNLSVLPFYSSTALQQHRKTYAYGRIYPLYARTGYMPTFQIIRNHRASTSFSGQLFRADDTFVASFNAGVAANFISVYQRTSYDVIVGYNVATQVFVGFGEGQYYIRLYDGVQTWYSEVFTWVDVLSGYLRLQWWDNANLLLNGGEIVYNNASNTNIFRNILYLPNELGKPSYDFEEEGEDRDGYFYPQTQVSTKTYKCNVLAPEFLCDAMRIIRLSDNILITDVDDINYQCNRFLITPKWVGDGDIANVEIEFNTDTVVKKIGKGYAQQAVADGDYNADYNNDFSV